MFVKRNVIKNYYTGNGFAVGMTEQELIDQVYNNRYSIVLDMTILGKSMPVYTTIPIVNCENNYCFTIPIKFMGLAIDTKTGLLNKKYNTLKDIEKEVRKELKKINLTLLSFRVAFISQDDGYSQSLYEHDFYIWAPDSY